MVEVLMRQNVERATQTGVYVAHIIICLSYDCINRVSIRRTIARGDDVLEVSIVLRRRDSGG